MSSLTRGRAARELDALRRGNDAVRTWLGLGLGSDPDVNLTLTFTITLTLPLHRHRSPLTAHLSPFTLTLTLTLTQVPLTHVYGSNSLWVESAPGLADFQPVEACCGQVLHFYGHP